MPTATAATALLPDSAQAIGRNKLMPAATGQGPRLPVAMLCATRVPL